MKKRINRKNTYKKIAILSTLSCTVLLSYSIYLSGQLNAYQKTTTVLLSPIPQELVIKTGGAQQPSVVATATPFPTVTVMPVTAPVPSNSAQREVYDMIGTVWGQDAEIGRMIAFCESTYGANIESRYSSARGVFQFINSTWVEERNAMGRDTNLDTRYHTQENIETAYSHFKKKGVKPWAASLKCHGVKN